MFQRTNTIAFILLPEPWLIDDLDNVPLGPLYVASYIRQHGFNPIIVDMLGRDINTISIPNAFIYGISAAVPQDDLLRCVARKIRQQNKYSIIVAGGPHASTVPEYILKTTEVDICVVGEGEQTFLEICERKNWMDIPGIWFKVDGTIVANSPRPLIKDIDSLPHPARDLVDMSRYHATVDYSDPSVRGASIVTSRGCAYKCAFCASPFIHKGKLRLHSVDYIMEEVNELIFHYGFDGLYFVDDFLPRPKKRCLELMERMAPLGIPWRCFSRVDMLDMETLEAMREAGCVGVDLGVESGDQRILDLIGKGTTVEQNLKAVEMCKEVGITPKCCLMLNLPGENDESVENTIQFIKKAKTRCNLNMFIPLPGCDIYFNPQNYGYDIDEGVPFSRYTSAGKSEANFEILSMNKEKVARWRKRVMDAIRDSGTFVFDTAWCKRKGKVTSFAGGGTVPASCKELGCNFLTFEIDPWR